MGTLGAVCLFFFNDTATTEIYTLSLHDALPIFCWTSVRGRRNPTPRRPRPRNPTKDRKSGSAGMPRPISYAVFCLKKKNKQKQHKYITDYLRRQVYRKDCCTSRACSIHSALSLSTSLYFFL